MCETGETSATCASDCQAQATCGNGTCESTESASSCPGDCGGGPGGGGTCPSDPLECFGCLLDPALCPAGLDETTCLNCIGGGGFPMP